MQGAPNERTDHRVEPDAPRTIIRVGAQLQSKSKIYDDDAGFNIRTDLPIQVRYAPHNPANSIIVAESWSGLRLNSSRPYHAD